MSKYFREQKHFKTILGIKKLGTSLVVILGTREYRQLFKENKEPPPHHPFLLGRLY